MKTINLNTGNQANEMSSMNHFFKEALTLEELFSIRGGNNDDEENKEFQGSDDDQQEDALID